LYLLLGFRSAAAAFAAAVFALGGGVIGKQTHSTEVARDQVGALTYLIKGARGAGVWRHRLVGHLVQAPGYVPQGHP
jgi:hypothetical protein